FVLLCLSELVAQADHVDPGVDVHVNLDPVAGQCGLAGGVDINVANLGVDHPVVVEHVIRTDLCRETPGIVQAQAAEAVVLRSAAEVFVKEPGEVHPGAHIGFEGRAVIQRIVDQADGGWQMFDASQFSVNRSAQSLYAYIMTERGGRQQLDTDAVGQHVGKVQPQLSITVQRGFATQVSRYGMLDAGAVFVRINSYRASTNNDVTGLVGLGNGSGQQRRGKQQGGGKSG